MTIRFAESKDKTAVLNLLDELLTDDAQKRGIKPTHTPVIEAGDKLFDKFVESDEYQILVAEDNDEVMGIATFFLYPVLRRGDFRAQLEELVVDKNHRDKGIGHALVNGVKAWCSDHGVSTIRINSQVANEKAHKLYEELGGEYAEKSFRFDL